VNFDLNVFQYFDRGMYIEVVVVICTKISSVCCERVCEVNSLVVVEVL